MSQSFDVILFDLGGVLIKLGPSPVPTDTLPATSQFVLGDWFNSAAAIAFEKGQVSPAVFADSLRQELGIDCDRKRLLEHFTRWPIGFYDGVRELLQTLRQDYRLAVLSNTNALHWNRFITEFGLAEQVDHIFASHLLAMCKPEPAIFRHVCDTLGCRPEQILFFDDNAVNVEAAGSLGLQAQQVQGIEQLTAALQARSAIAARQ
jgi:putative hydrolase of the HAD superfamily